LSCSLFVVRLPGNGRSSGSYLDTFTYDYRGRVEEHSQEINGRTYTMTVNQFDELDRPITMHACPPHNTADTSL
jgi:hypothetical protein